jgi:hypothetical protein
MSSAVQSKPTRRRAIEEPTEEPSWAIEDSSVLPGTDEGRRHSLLTRAVRELETTRIEPDYSGRKRMRREGNGVNMHSLADEIRRETEASVRASSSADYGDTDPLQEIRRRLRKLTYGDMITMAEQITGVEGYKPAANTEEMAAMLHRWSTTEQSDAAVERGITGVEGHKPAANTEEMAAMLHRWSSTEQSDAAVEVAPEKVCT